MERLTEKDPPWIDDEFWTTAREPDDEALQEKGERDKGCSELQGDENFIQTKFGYCFYSLNSCPIIYNLYVHPQYRRCGHSKKLLQCVIAEIKKAGYVGEIKIQAEPREDSIDLTKLMKYYDDLGLTIYKDKKGAKRNEREERRGI